MLHALNQFTSIVYDNEHWDVQIQRLIKFIDSFEWSTSELKLCNWQDKIYVNGIDCHLYMEIYRPVGKYTHVNRNDKCPKADYSYRLTYTFSIEHKSSEQHPLKKKWDELFEDGYIDLNSEEDFAMAEKILLEMEKFFMNPFNYRINDELDSPQLSLHEFLQTEKGQRSYKAGYQAMELSFNEGHSYPDSSLPSGSLEYEAFHEGVRDAFTVLGGLGKT